MNLNMQEQIYACTWSLAWELVPVNSAARALQSLRRSNASTYQFPKYQQSVRTLSSGEICKLSSTD